MLKRLQFLVQNIGGYEALAAALPVHTAKIWKSKVEQIGRFKLMMKDFELLADFFKDSVLIALFGNKHGFAYIDLNSIPPSDYSLADLSWALRKYQAQSQLLACDLRERLLDGKCTDEIAASLRQISKECIVLVKQMQLALNQHN